MSEFIDKIKRTKESLISNLSLGVHDSFRGRGNVVIQKVRKSDGKVVETLENHNLIVKVGRSEMVKLIAKASTKGVTKMAIGKGGANLVTSPFSPTAPTDSDNDLYSRITFVTISSAVVNTSGTNPKVTFVALFDCDVINSLVNEVGLFFDDNSTIFARHTFKTVSLETGTDFALNVSWTIEF